MEFYSLIIVLGLTFIAWWRILPRIGWSRWMAVLFAFPLIGLIPLLLFAYLRWPIDRYLAGATPDYSQARGPSMAEQDRETTSYCSDCGEPNPATENICRRCGKELQSGQPNSPV